jgi:plasmid stabilization system protein ParE
MVRWTSPAKNDLKKIYDYIASDIHTGLFMR